MPLSFANIGDSCIISRIEGRDAVVSHLNNLGFIVGETVNVVTKLAGNMIIEVKGTRVALDAKLANKIYI